MKLRKSYALKKFKEEVGQANHMLITILVGLDGIIAHDLEANEDFHTSWNPKSKAESVRRSKNYAKKSTLAWVVDCIDMYLRIINREPSLISDSSLKKEIDDDTNSRSVYIRLTSLSKYLDINSIEYAMVDLLICWRNRLTHYQAKNNITTAHRNLLIENEATIHKIYCGLNITETLDNFDKSCIPTFKEVTSLVRASLILITHIDETLVNKVNQVVYADKVLLYYFRENKTERLNNIFSKDSTIAEKSIRQILIQKGFSNIDISDVDKYCKKTSTYTFKQAQQMVDTGSFI